WRAPSAVAILPRKKRLSDPNLRDRLYELLEHDHLPYSVGSRFAQLIVCIIVIDVLAMVLASVPEFDARFGTLFTAIKVGAVVVFALEYAARLWSVAGHSPRKLSPAQDRIEYALSSLGIIDLLAFLPVSIALVAGQRSLLVLFGVLPLAIISTAFADEVRRRDFVVTWGMLARVPLFSHLSATEIADIMRLLRARTIEAGEVLVWRGDPASSMYFITAGEVEIELPNQRVRLSDGTFFGEIALLHRTKRSGTGTATRKTRLLALDAQDFHALIERMPALAAHVQKTAKARLA